MMTTKKIQLNTWGRNYVAVSAGQGEVNSRFLEITLVDEAGNMTLTNKEVVLYAVKPDDNVIYNSCTIENASQMIVSVELTSQMSSTPGVMACELHVTGASQEVLKIVGLEIIILECSDISKSVESTSEFTRLSEALSEVETLKDNYQEIIDSTLTYSYLGVCPVSYGGTGTASLASGNILIGNGTSSVTSLATLTVAKGGTGATTASGARTNLELVTESGSWTPTIGNSVSPDPTVTYTTQYGRYYAIGDLVFVLCLIEFQISNKGGNTPRILGLPYAPYVYVYGTSLQITGNDYAFGSTNVRVTTSSSYVKIIDNNGSVTAWSVYDSSHTQRIGFSGCYRKA